MSGHDSKYFSTTKKGEIPELKEELNSQYKDKRKDAVKKVIAAMTVGKDVSSLFTDVVNCMQTENLELKKLVYLYLINYAKSQPDLAILAVNTFVKDSQDPNPLIRALAVRTMGCIRVDKITEYLCDPLQRCLKDDDPYVRKTAAICVAKLYDINAELVEDRGFLDALKDLISDNNPMVVANAVAALAEIQESSSRPIFEITSHTLSKLLTALNECTEWGQVFILDALSKYKAADAREAENIVERVTPRLQHANCAVVLSAVKMILQQMELITSTDVVRNLCKKMAPPLVTLLSAEPEIQYVALMTNYGTIPTSSSGPVNVEFISRAKDVLKEGLAARRPWKEMFNFHSFNLPSGVSDAISRIKTNFSFFQTNYAIIVLVIVFLSLLWHPISLIVFIVLMAVWLFLYFLRDEPLVIFGRLISDSTVLIVLSVLTLALLLFTGATSNILISLAVGVFVVLIHASIRKTDDLFLDEEAAGFLRSAPSS